MKHIQKISTYLLYAINLWIVSQVLLLVGQWIFIDTPTVKHFLSEGFISNPIRTPEGILTLGDVTWTTSSKIILILSEIIAGLPFFISLFALRSLFKNYQMGEVFNVQNVLLYKRLGWLLFLDALFAKSIGNCLKVLAVTLSNAPGHRYITLSFGTPNLEAIFWGIIVIVISSVMREASRLQDEQKFTI